MTPAALLAFMLSLVGGRAPDGIVEYRDAIIATDASPEELRVLAVVARFETYYHLHSRTPPFGLTERRQRGLRALTLRGTTVCRSNHRVAPPPGGDNR
jgi:hypothetical protein